MPQEVLDKIENFSAAEWELVMCEVRMDKGKFVTGGELYNFVARVNAELNHKAM